MATIQQDIINQSEWIVKAFESEGLTLDYSVHSFIEIDKFFYRHSKNGKSVSGGRLANNRGTIIFSLGCYVGQTFVKSISNTVWEISETDDESGINSGIKFPNGAIVWPIQRVTKRYQNGPEDSIYVYGHSLTEEYLKEPFDQEYWNLDSGESTTKKPWWKLW
jgi:hypothetical protein